ncbi:MAG: hypothetical protein SF187_00750 [Deltaproteobacteria bacterium]|nr:hypothetical protein [Deltaproteobacteria bacterium]
MSSRAVLFLVRGWRSAAIFLLALAAAVWLHHVFAAVVPSASWLAWDLLRLWAWQLVLSAACVSAGVAVLAWADAKEGASWEVMALGFPIGLVIFSVGFYLLGYVRGFVPWVAVAWPVLLIVCGARSLWLQLRAPQPEQAAALTRALSLQLVMWLCGGMGVGLAYLGVLSPDSINYDAAWMHLVIAQDYARAGRVIPFYGDWVKSVPHLASVLHTWDFVVPGLGQAKPLRWMMSLHTEFTVFVWTLVGIAAAVNMVVGRVVRGAWTAMFLFPAILAYDSNMGGAADHILAVFAVPLVWFGMLVAKRFAWRLCAVWGCVAGGALLVKLQAVYVIAPVASYLCVCWLVHVWRLWRGGALRARVVAALFVRLATMPVLAMVVFAVHALPNWLVHHNPLYPLAQDIFVHSRPRVAGAVTQVKYLFGDWQAHPPAELGTRLIEAVKLLWSFSFTPHYSFQKNVPITGSLFTLCLPFLLFVRANRRVWSLAGFALAAVFAWAMTYWVDRNLQVFMPLLVVVTAVLLCLAWQTGRVAKAGVVVLVAMQLVAAGDVWFSGMDRIHGAITLIRSSAEARADRRYATYRAPYITLGEALPPKAVVLLHNEHGSLGIDRKVLIDWAGFQGLIDYRTMNSVRDLWNTYRRLGVTHVVFGPTLHAAPSKQEEVLFAVFSRLFGADTKYYGGLQMFPLPPNPPSAQALKVGVLAVGGVPDGVYDVRELGHLDALPPQFWVPPQPLLATADPAPVLAQSDAVIVGNNVSAELNVKLADAWQALVYTPGYRVFARRSLAAARPGP